MIPPGLNLSPNLHDRYPLIADPTPDALPAARDAMAAPRTVGRKHSRSLLTRTSFHLFPRA